jgi:hypothetical protein
MSRPETQADPLIHLGDALHAAAAADLAQSSDRTAVRAPRPIRRKRRVVAGAMVAALIAVPGAAFAANALISNDEVARSIPNGTLALLGTEPSCTTVREGIEFECTLAKAPTGELGPGAWKGTVEPSVDDQARVNGGCRSENAAGTQWRCYVGEEAVRRQIVGPDLLGQYSPGPGVG